MLMGLVSIQLGPSECPVWPLRAHFNVSSYGGYRYSLNVLTGGLKCVIRVNYPKAFSNAQ